MASDEIGQPPKRRLHLTLDLHADDWSALSEAFGDVRHAIFVDDADDVTMGGSSAGYHFRLTDDPSMTPGQYRARLDEYLAAKRKEPSDG